MLKIAITGLVIVVCCLLKAGLDETMNNRAKKEKEKC